MIRTDYNILDQHFSRWQFNLPPDVRVFDVWIPMRRCKMIDFYVSTVLEVIHLILLHLILVLNELVRLSAYTLCYPDTRHEAHANLIIWCNLQNNKKCYRQMVLMITYSVKKVLEGLFVGGLDRYVFVEILNLQGEAPPFPLCWIFSKGEHFSL